MLRDSKGHTRNDSRNLQQRPETTRGVAGENEMDTTPQHTDSRPADYTLRSCWWFTSRKCPECGGDLITDGRSIWCSFIGDNGQGVRACSYGIRERESL